MQSLFIPIGHTDNGQRLGVWAEYHYLDVTGKEKVHFNVMLERGAKHIELLVMAVHDKIKAVAVTTQAELQSQQPLPHSTLCRTASFTLPAKYVTLTLFDCMQ